MSTITQKLLMWKARIREMHSRGSAHLVERVPGFDRLPRFAREYLRGFRDGLKEGRAR